ncbi:MAG TPA: hypothetical protein VFN49_09405, partial [Candidatus Aquilonibacter sp.]|nr:hypothetical protein [Candidatus Aquilonibacter sp.]
MKRPALAFPIFSLALTACGGGGGAGAATAVPVAVATASATASATYTCPAAQTSAGTLNCAALPLGDLKYSTSGAQRGSIYLCHV